MDNIKNILEGLSGELNELQLRESEEVQVLEDIKNEFGLKEVKGDKKDTFVIEGSYSTFYVQIVKYYGGEYGVQWGLHKKGQSFDYYSGSLSEVSVKVDRLEDIKEVVRQNCYRVLGDISKDTSNFYKHFR